MGRKPYRGWCGAEAMATWFTQLRTNLRDVPVAGMNSWAARDLYRAIDSGCAEDKFWNYQILLDVEHILGPYFPALQKRFAQYVYVGPGTKPALLYLYGPAALAGPDRFLVQFYREVRNVLQ